MTYKNTKAEDDHKFITAMFENDTDCMKNMFKAGYNPSGLRIPNRHPPHNISDMLADAIGDIFTDNYGTVTALSWTMLNGASSHRPKMGELIIDRLKEVHADNPEKLAQELIDGYCKPVFFSKMLRTQEEKEAVYSCNNKIISALKETIPKLNGYLRSETERKAQNMESSIKEWRR